LPTINLENLLTKTKTANNFRIQKSAASRGSAAVSRRRCTSDTAEPATARIRRTSEDAVVAMETAGHIVISAV